MIYLNILRVIRKNDDPFGGIQLILCGDFLQLPPVTKQGEKRKFTFQVYYQENVLLRACD